MKLLNDHHSFVGMQRDIVNLKQPTSFLYDAKNIRLTSRGGDTMYAITNEKGTKTTELSIRGTYLGHCLLNQYLVVFSTTSQGSTPDYITRIDLGDNSSKILYNGNLNFKIDAAIEAIPSYENENIQKIYWTDGLNQPRIINIVADSSRFNDSCFDFVRELSLKEKVTIKKIFSSGKFASGVIQYAFTYYTKYGQESNIFYTSPLLYVSPKDRGASPEETVNNAFEIQVKNIDHGFDYLRIYSIQRTSINGTPITKRVQDISLGHLHESCIYSNIVPQVKQGESYVDFDAYESSYTGTINNIYATWRLISKHSFQEDHFKVSDGFITWGDKATDNSCLCVTSTKVDTSYGSAYCIVEVSDPVDLIVEPIRHSNTPVFEDSVSFIDTGIGDIIDPTELLYKGGESIIAQTIEQKEGTLFLGGITLSRNPINNIKSQIVEGTAISESMRDFYVSSTEAVTNIYRYINQLTATDNNSNNVPCAGFKRGDYYRCGIQFQYKDGKWSDPIFLQDKEITNKPETSSVYTYSVPVLNATISDSISNLLKANGYRRARAVVVFPKMEERIVLCQGVVSPTLQRGRSSLDEGTKIVSSWFFRPYIPDSGDRVMDLSDSFVDPKDLPSVEIGGGIYSLDQPTSNNNRFYIYKNKLSYHSPDIEFDNAFSIDSTGLVQRQVGYSSFWFNLWDTEIQTESPTIDSKSSGFLHSSGITSPYKYSSDTLYEDGLVDYINNSYTTNPSFSKLKWMVYTWQPSGSLNNDINRPTNAGARSSVLKKKIISTLRVASTHLDSNIDSVEELTPAYPSPQLFNSDTPSILKFGSSGDVTYTIYEGNIDTMIPSATEGGNYFKNSQQGWGLVKNKIIYAYQADNSRWVTTGGATLVDGREEGIRMKYKSTPHLVISNQDFDFERDSYSLPVVEICRKKPYNIFGGLSEDALMSNVWIPCGEPIILGETFDGYAGPHTEGSTIVQYSWGDTYYQRYDCLKTYPFTSEDVNQVVEIGSFMLETRVNIDGRYDRNRGQINNLNMTPRNFNLINPIYSQLNNFFTYRILEEDYYNISQYPNEITWTKEKKSGADVDLWTNITLASTYDIDGSKGKIVSLNTWKTQLYCFQNKGVSSILFNSRVQIPTSDGVPIEISNNYKVDGYRYIGDGIGCNNKFLIKETTSGIYFIDSANNQLCHISDNIQNIAISHNMSSWFKNNYDSITKIVHDDVNHDVYIVTDNNVLCFSETLGQFVSFLDYGGVSLIESFHNKVFTLKNSVLYEMFEGPYNYFFTEEKPWEFTFISNGIDNNTQDFDKIFTNIDCRLDIFDSDNEYKADDFLSIIRVTNEYQDTTEVALSRLKVVNNPKSYHHSDANLQKKFRIWRIQIPRDNIHKLDRIRNPWCKITLKGSGTNNRKAVLQDLNVQYYI